MGNDKKRFLVEFTIGIKFPPDGVRYFDKDKWVPFVPFPGLNIVFAGTERAVRDVVFDPESGSLTVFMNENTSSETAADNVAQGLICDGWRESK